MLNMFPGAAVGFALLSLLFAGVLDVLYKRYASAARSRGLYLMGMGLAFGALQLFASVLTAAPLVFDLATVQYGLLAGLLVTASNIALIESFTHLDVSLGSTIYRLNTIGVVLFSVIFLAEALPALRLGGIVFGVLAALLLYRHHAQQADRRAVALCFWIAVLASALRAGFGVVSKAGIVAGGDAAAMMSIAAASWVVGGLGYALVREPGARINPVIAGYAIASGCVVFLVINTLFAALARSDASVVIPIANLSFVVALIISLLLRMERLSARKLVALAFAVTAIVLLSQSAP